MVIFLVLGLVLLAGLIVGLIVRGFFVTREDRRRLEALATRLLAEQRVDQLTRSAMAAMRDTARQAFRDQTT